MKYDDKPKPLITLHQKIAVVNYYTTLAVIHSSLAFGIKHNLVNCFKSGVLHAIIYSLKAILKTSLIFFYRITNSFIFLSSTFIHSVNLL